MQKNRQLFEQFIGQNLNGAYRFAYSYVKNQQDAEDIVSQSVIKALSQVHRLKEITAMKSWFYRIIANSANSYLRKGKKVVYLESEEWDVVGSVTDSYEMCIRDSPTPAGPTSFSIDITGISNQTTILIGSKTA